MGEVFGERTVTARKQHTCYWCGEFILPGETYAKWVWKAWGDFDSVKTHIECRHAWGEMALQEGSPFETMPYEFSRGCTCERGHCCCEDKEKEGE